MRPPSTDRIGDLLRERRAQLDVILGAGQYRIEEIDSDIVLVHASSFELEVVFDRRRMREVTAFIELRDVPDELAIRMPVDLWMRFLGQQAAPLAKDESGMIPLPPDEQIDAALKWVALLSGAVFASPEKTRDAAYFARGYHTAYNDWASRSGSWIDD